MYNEKNILALRIYQMRKELDLTQEELALKLGLKGKSSIANYESGNIVPSDEIKKKMCEVFDCTMDYLMGISEFKNEKDYISSNELSFQKMYDNSLNEKDKQIINSILNKIKDLKISDKNVYQFIQDEVNKTNSNFKKILPLIIYRYYGRMYPLENYKDTIDVFQTKSDALNVEELKNIPHANSSGLDTTGLEEEDLKELQAQIDYMKWKKNNK